MTLLSAIMTSNPKDSSLAINTPEKISLWQLFVIFLRLGLTSFGGPAAHIGFFRDEFVFKRQWLKEQDYGDLVSFCQFLPGPASSQVGIAIGLEKRGILGAIVTWVGFTLPSALLLFLVAIGLTEFSNTIPQTLIDSLQIAAIIVIAQATFAMGKSFCPNYQTLILMIITAFLVLLIPSSYAQIGLLIVAGIIGIFFLKPHSKTTINAPINTLSDPINRGLPHSAKISLILFIGLLAVLPIITIVFKNDLIALFDLFYRTGSIVFGGGHTILPLLHHETVTTGMVSEAHFLAGYGAAQVVPGPLFTFAAFIGAKVPTTIPIAMTALICIVAIFLPSFLMIIGLMAIWEKLRQKSTIRAALIGVNAAVTGLLLAALLSAIYLVGFNQAHHYYVLLLGLFLLFFVKLPAWLIVIISALFGILLSFL